jgi:hypothetical protein
MGEIVSDEIDETKILMRSCAGRCGVILRYRLGPYREGYIQELTCLDGYTAYRGGHLCGDCDVVVAEALAARCEQRQRKRWTEARAARKVRVRAQRGKR